MRALRLVVPAACVLLGCGADAFATTYPVGATRAYTSPCALAAAVTLAPGDVIQVDAGTYTDACQLKDSGTAAAPITLMGVPGPRPVFDATGVDLSGSGSVPRAILQFTGGSFWVVEHLELENGSNASANGAGFRITAGAHDITLRDVSIHGNQDGGMMDGAATLDLESSDLYANGAGDGYSHNLYLQGQRAILVGNHIHDSNGGQNVKLRCHYAELRYNLIENAGNYEMDFIQGPDTATANANIVLIGNVVVRPVSSGNDSQVILYGSDNAGQPGRSGSVYAINNTFVLQNAKNHLFHAINPPSGEGIHLYGNVIATTVGGAALSTDATTDGVIDGTDNWIATAVTFPSGLSGTITGVAPGFVAVGDYHLAAGSPAIDGATPSPTYLDDGGVTQSGTPVFELSAPYGTTGRPSDGRLDMGAYEFAVGTDGGAGTLDAGGSHGDSGSTDVARRDGGGPTGTRTSGCGCRVLGARRGDAPGGMLVVLAGLAGLGLSRRLRARSAPRRRCR